MTIVCSIRWGLPRGKPLESVVAPDVLVENRPRAFFFEEFGRRMSKQASICKAAP
jgi:hypothetical protein